MYHLPQILPLHQFCQVSSQTVAEATAQADPA
jgi:hypothetical protein